MNEWATWERRKRLETAAAALEANGFATTLCADGAAVVAAIEAEARDARTVGFGGSVSLAELGVPNLLANQGKECLLHGAPGLTLEERLAVMRRALTCDLYLTGVNAVTLDGKLVNIDATGNRVGAMSFGPGKVVAVAGANKLATDVHDAVRRVREWAAPPNARRLGVKTPCVETGFCADCRSPQRICRIVHIMEKCPRLTNLRVLLVAEPLGL